MWKILPIPPRIFQVALVIELSATNAVPEKSVEGSESWILFENNEIEAPECY